MIYKLDTHVHTAEVSSCALVKAEDVAQTYKDIGYDAIVVTDHYYNGFFERLGDLTWEEKVESYLAGYRAARKMGQVIGLNVILGMELRFLGSINDHLVYGFDESFLLEYPELYSLDLPSFRRLTEPMGIMIYQAHPFRPGMTLAPARYLDGVEVMNGHPRHNSRNDLAMAHAVREGLKKLSGSDAHEDGDAGTGGIIVHREVSDSKDLTEILREEGYICLLNGKEKVPNIEYTT